MRGLRLALAQINTTVGDFAGNLQKIVDAITQARALKVDLLAFPELAICGYPPEDLLLKPYFIEENLKALDQVVKESTGLSVVIGFVDARSELYNAAALIHDGQLKGIYHKIHLPNYGVFDEYRYFRPGNECQLYVIGGIGVGINICEDIWYEAGPTTVQAAAGAEVIVNISASPYHAGKQEIRQRMLATRADDCIAIVAYNNLVGGQDELVFDGGSMVLDEAGRLIARGKQFAEDLVVTDLDVEAVFRTRLHDPRWRQVTPVDEPRWPLTRVLVSEEPATAAKPLLEPGFAPIYRFPDEVYAALVLGTHDYVIKNGFEKVVIGLSGGLDSSLVANIAVDALGQANVIGVSMPSRYSSPGSKTDAGLLAQNLGIRLMNIPIEPVFRSYLKLLAEAFKGTEPNVTEENIQARIRGNILMALSNKFGWLVLTTGNKSEMATGFTTLYGDMAGGFAVLKDVPKMMEYELVKYRNSVAGFELIPTSVLEKAPSPELKPDQKTTDTLPPYPNLDPVLTAYVEEDKSIEQIVAMGFDKKMVEQVARMVDKSEYKRRQSPPGIKITHRAFGRDRRLPITNRFKG